MKVLDMFGSQLPVLAVNFKALPELITPGINGYIFKNATELTDYIIHLFFTPKTNLSSLLSLKQSLLSNNNTISNWDDNWNKNMQPLVRKFIKYESNSPILKVGVVLVLVLVSSYLYFLFYKL